MGVNEIITMVKAIFWDRDGVINEVTVVNNKALGPRNFADFKLTEGVHEHFQKTRELEFKNIVVTNQPDIARGLITVELLNEMHALMEKELLVDEINVCPHDNNQCDCRKPLPGLIIKSAQRNDIDLSKSYIIGDTKKDMLAGKAAGCKAILLQRDYNIDAVDFADYAITNITEMFNFI